MELIHKWLAQNEGYREQLVFTHILQNGPKKLGYEDTISLLAASGRIQVSKILPRGEFLENKLERRRWPRKLRFEKVLAFFGGIEIGVGFSDEEKANLIFGILRLFLRNRYVQEERIGWVIRKIAYDSSIIEPLASIFPQISENLDEISTILQILRDYAENQLKLVLRLVAEVLITISQRGEMVHEIPDIELKARIYCRKIVKLIDEVYEDAIKAAKIDEKPKLREILNDFVRNDEDIMMLVER